MNSTSYVAFTGESQQDRTRTGPRVGPFCDWSTYGVQHRPAVPLLDDPNVNLILENRGECVGCFRVCLLRPFGIALEQHRWAMAAARRYNGHTGIKQCRFMRPAKVVEAELDVAQLFRLPSKLLTEFTAVAWRAEN